MRMLSFVLKGARTTLAARPFVLIVIEGQLQCRQLARFKQIFAARETMEVMDKVAMLSEILAQNPTDAFARYGLAMEYAGRGETENSLQEFARLLTGHPDYTAGYFMAAQTLAKAGRNPEARGRLSEGIASARRTGNQHALNEMQAMLDELELVE
jgi:predicted Zn-dependent protease